MNTYEATERAYKNGYEAGKRDAAAGYSGGGQMKVTVEMTAEEFQEFLRYKADKGCFDADRKDADRKMEVLNKKIMWALEEDEKKPGKIKIISQEHAAELVEMATEWFC